MVLRNRHLSAQDAVVDGLRQEESAGVGVRALIGSSWGFFATPDLNETAARRAGENAAAIARASAAVSGPPLALAETAPAQGHFATPHEEDPLAVSPTGHAELLLAATARMREVRGVSTARALMGFYETSKWCVSSEGHRISQRLVESGGGIDATAVGETETQRRSYPQSYGQWNTGGYEVVRGYDLLAHAHRVGEEAVALLSAPQCEPATRDLVLEGSQVALQI